MTEHYAASALFAQQTVIEQMGRRFRPGGNSFDLTDAIIWMLFIAGTVALVWVLHKLVTQVAQAKKHSLNRLFGQLCVAHGIGWQGRRLLYRLAGVHGLPHPAHLFVRSECFRPQTLPPEMLALQRDVANLHAILFGGHNENVATGRC